MTIDWLLGGLSLSTLAIALALVFGASIMRGLTGFGLAIILVPLLGLIVEPAEAVVISILLQLLAGPIGLRRILADGERATAIPISIAAILATPFGVWLLSVTAPDVARLAIALLALAAFGLMFVPAKEGAIPGRKETLATGIAAGVLTGFASMPGPPVVPFYLRRKLPPDVARASMLMVFFATAIAGSIASFALGVANLHLLWLSVLFYPALYIGTRLGEMAFGKVSEPVWRTLVGIILGVAGMAAMGRLLN
ncbi:sulfite exporter TauE/SafE family protein [Sphingorhabdus sp.]|uniref:sulfite exporter TauE/SafE family protein n=1 Tax=Sphingorhabdus sp. TaxID=1902408 RepID=UPI002CC9D3E1|nr:sulfite exporter TauE/SafE family protein [Sphingorhabdus sp.]HMT42635.1 sulfite exporter TauE/SafE family protein [Sphingorhabdus sp.]